jgi:anthranilate phosphoribosyltransferase
MKKVVPGEIHGGSTVEEAAGIFLRILEGKGSEAQNEVVVANAAFALYCMDENQGLEAGIERARHSLESGSALKTFKNLVGGA